jgi:hypothetical protein
MKIDKRGGASADSNLEGRLATRFAAELERAEKDYPAIARKLEQDGSAGAGRGRESTRIWPRLVALPVGVAAAAIALLALSPLLLPAASPAPGGIPTEIDGRRVYRAADKDSFPTSGSFLLGGVVTMPEFIPPCPALPTPGVEDDLIPYCWWVAVDGIRVAPRTADLLSDLRFWSVVARVHINDSQAGLCPAALRNECTAAVVVEEVVWRAEPVGSPVPPTQPMPTFSVAPGGSPETVLTPPPSVTPSALPLGPDGIPTSIDGQTVYRAAALPSQLTSFYLGGMLTRDETCPAPASPLAKPPSCGYWMVDGLRVGTQILPDESLLGRPVVAAIQVSRSLAVCPDGSCTQTTLVVLWIVWPVGIFPPSDDQSPPPAASVPPAVVPSATGPLAT